MNNRELMDEVFVFLAGRSALLELKIKLLLNRDKQEIKKQSSCSEAKKLMYDKYSNHISDEDKKVIDKAVWIRNKLVHLELSAILGKQQHIQSKAVVETINPNDVRSVLKGIENIREGKADPVDEKSPLYGQYLELVHNTERVRELQDVLDKAIQIIYQVVCDSLCKVKN